MTINPDILNTAVPAILNTDSFGTATVRRYESNVDVFVYTDTVCIATDADNVAEVGIGVYLTADETRDLARRLDAAAALLTSPRQSPR